jgi:hypothetical protein
MKTLLINLPYPYSEVPIIPIGIAYIASVLEQNGCEVQVLDSVPVERILFSNGGKKP